MKKQINSKDLGAALKKARLMHGLTQTAYGEKINVTNVTVGRRESGKNPPAAVDAINLLLEHGKGLDYFFQD